MNLGHLMNKQEQASWWGREHQLIDAKIKAWASLITGPTAPGEGAIDPGGRDVPPGGGGVTPRGPRVLLGLSQPVEAGTLSTTPQSHSVLLLEVPGPQKDGLELRRGIK